MEHQGRDAKRSIQTPPFPRKRENNDARFVCKHRRAVRTSKNSRTTGIHQEFRHESFPSRSLNKNPRVENRRCCRVLIDLGTDTRF
jgi:hypothetical protein